MVPIDGLERLTGKISETSNGGLWEGRTKQLRAGPKPDKGRPGEVQKSWEIFVGLAKSRQV